MKWTENKVILIVIVLAVLLRIFASIYTNNLYEQNYFEYGSLAENMVNGKGYSLFHFEGDTLTHIYSQHATPYPSAYMPIAYPILISPAFIFTNPILTNSYILFVNLIFDILSIILLFQLTKMIFNKNTAFIAIIIFAILPEFIFSSTITGISSAYHFFILLILYRIKLLQLNQSMRNLFFLSISFGFFLYFRSEPLIFLVFVILYLWKLKKTQHLLILIFIPLLMIIPFQLRNYYVFNKFVPLTTSAGLNLYRGNNSEKIGSWGDEDIFKYRQSLKNEKNFELKLNDYYMQKSINYIINNKTEVFLNSFRKIYQLWIFNTDDERVFNIFYLIPWVILLIIFFYSFNFLKIEQIDVILIFLVYSTLNAMIFFALPRYQAMMKIGLIPIVSYIIHCIIYGRKNRN